MINQELKIRHADPKLDSKNIADLINYCVENRWTVLNRFTEKKEAEYLQNLHPRQCVYVAYIGGEFAGFSGIAPKFSYSDRMRHCAEGGTWVRREYWGTGVSKKLWDEGNFPFGDSVGFRHYSHSVPTNNMRAVRHYEKMGFRVCGYHRMYVEWSPGEYCDAVEMELWR